MNDRFTANLVPVEEEAKYIHGFSEVEVSRIKRERKEIEGKEITLEMFKNIVVPYLRITRTEAFNLNVEKVKPPKIPKPPKPPKPPTKAALKKKHKLLINNVKEGITVSEEEVNFLKKYNEAIENNISPETLQW
jgi:hypothetical protein